jgi:hypothetical protein
MEEIIAEPELEIVEEAEPELEPEPEPEPELEPEPLAPESEAPESISEDIVESENEILDPPLETEEPEQSAESPYMEYSDAESTDIDELDLDGEEAAPPTFEPAARNKRPINLLPEQSAPAKESVQLRPGETNRPDEKLFNDTDIMHAIRTGSEEKVAAVIDSMRGKSANNQQAAENLSVYVNENGENCIHLALRCNNPKVMEMVLEDVLKPLNERKQAGLLNKKSAEYRDIDGAVIKSATPLEIARESGRVGMITEKGIATEPPAARGFAAKVLAAREASASVENVR